ncbi:hypothetical protein Clacol_001378 [Clathrus columnatus]|uniref:Uncharacterized protein n=1 Tax=Clathrus columnatus TaxID=1419009 RepID=A0AAV5A1T1_9AGAM|nr:hypothetical protein Clacol_001378 [Clathrus columnatus]
MPAFSRLQLAAALIEYDNDPDDPNPSRKAQDSAIFVRLRTRDPARARKLSGYDHHRVTPNHLGVQLPVNDAASARVSTHQRRSLLDTRTSRGSVDLLRNPFGGDDIAESEAGGEHEQGSDEEPEVDLEAWGMTNFLGDKEDLSRSRQRMHQRERRRSRAQSEILPNPYSPDESAPRPAFLQHNSRAKSLGGIGDNLEPFSGLLVASEADFRRRTISAPLDPAGRITPDFQKPLSQGSPKLLPNRSALDLHPLAPSPNHIPFPTGTPEPERDEETNMFELPLTAPTSRFDPKVSRLRATSQGSIHSQVKPNQDGNLPSDNSQDDIFAAFSDRASRFDPGSLMDNIRPLSMASFGGTMGTLGIPGENNRSPSPGRTSHADMRMGHTRTISNASLGSRLPPENEQELAEEANHPPRRFSRLDLLRPKLLIMPTPLQGTEEQAIPPPIDVPAGFQLATLGPPLPNIAEPKPNSLTPNPRTSLTLSQLTFRNSLMNDGQRDVTFVDIERNLRRAEKDGEQIVQEQDIEGEIAQEQRQSHGRPAGKLYGRSLMDELQARKEKIKSKQRVFTGDQRPSMMSRGQVRRSGTLIDPSTLRDRPSPQGQGQGQGQDEKTDLQRRPSKSKPLLNFDADPRGNRPSGNDKSNNSVFGVDQLWERELQRLKIIEAAEKEQEEENRLREAEKAAKKAKKKRKDGLAQTPAAEIPPQPAQRMSVVPDLPPTLPDIPKTAARRAPRPVEDESESEADSEASARAAKANAAKMARMISPSQGWLSSDDEGGHRKKQITAPPKLPSDSDEDLPLSTLAQVGALRPRLPARNSDSEDEQPLSQVLQKKSVLSLPDFGVGHFNLNTAQAVPTMREDEEEEDDVPLAVRHPRGQSMFMQSHGDDDDDKPLALKQFETQQQQQAQYHNLLAQQQMMMMQPAMSMPFAAPSMMNGFSPFMMAPPPIYAPQPVLPDAAKFQSVDRWRHGVEN